jgi:type VI secretion system protein ImpH
VKPDPPTEPAAPTPRQRLEREPRRFDLDQAVKVLAAGRDPVELPFSTVAHLGAPEGEVELQRDGSLATPTFGLLGPGGVLPRHYTAWVDAERRRSPALHAFLDLLARRFTGLYAKAGAKHRPTRDPSAAERVLAAAVGLGTPGLAQRLQTPLPELLHHAGPLAARSRSAERLRGLLAEEAGTAVRIVEFAGGWVRLPRSEQSRLQGPGQPAQHARLGVDAALGEQVWDPSARFVIRLGPMPLAHFRRLLPGQPLHTRLVELVRLHVGLEQDFAFNPVLEGAAAPPLQLGRGSQLGWTGWLGQPRARHADAGEAMLRPREGA